MAIYFIIFIAIIILQRYQIFENMEFFSFKEYVEKKNLWDEKKCVILQTEIGERKSCFVFVNTCSLEGYRRDAGVVDRGGLENR